MRYTIGRLHVWAGVVMGLTITFWGNNGSGAAKAKPLPPEESVKTAVDAYFAKQADLQAGDILSRSQVEPLLAQLAQMGFVVPDRDDILNKVPADDELLVSNLRTPAGRKFMRSIAAYPDAYDRLDRLLRLPQGKQRVHDLIQGPGGRELIKYLTTTPGGRAMGKQLSGAPLGADFNEPTGRIYTVKMLWSRLSKSYAAAKQKAATTTAPGKPT